MGQERPRRLWEGVAGSESPVVSAELIVFGIWGALAPLAAGPLGLTGAMSPVVEAVDEVVPALTVVCVALLALRAARRRFTGSVLVVAAGAVMTATHVSPLVQAAQGKQDLVAALWATVPGVAILLLGWIAAVVDRLPSPARLAEAPAQPVNAAEQAVAGHPLGRATGDGRDPA